MSNYLSLIDGGTVLKRISRLASDSVHTLEYPENEIVARNIKIKVFFMGLIENFYL